MNALSGFIGNIDRLIITPIIGLLFACALFYFFYGLVTFMANADKPEMRAKGTRMLYNSILGFAIMVGVIGILTVVTGTFGVHLPS